MGNAEDINGADDYRTGHRVSKSSFGNPSRAAVITPFGLFNYGNRLQNYAVAQILTRAGFKAVTLIFPRRSVKAKAGVVLDGLKSFLKAPSTWLKRRAAFKEFNEAMDFQRVGGSVAAYSQLDKKYDLFVIGSDQVWNPNFVQWGGAEYANFVDPQKVVCIAPSFGVTQVPESTKISVQKYLPTYRGLSVREQSGFDIIVQLIDREPTVACDPTLMLDSYDWRKVSSDAYTPKSPYIFSYLLGQDDQVIEQVRAFAHRRNLLLVSLTDSARRGQIPAGPQHFLSLVEHAKCVVTDSFHAVIFSELYGRDLYIYPRAGGEDMGSRIETLYSTLGLVASDVGELAGADRIDFRSERSKEFLAVQKGILRKFLESAGIEDASGE